MTTTSSKAISLELDHPELSAACAKLVQARGVKNQIEDTEKAQKAIIKTYLEEFPETKEFILPEYLIAWGENNYQKAPVFKKYLIDSGVDPEVIQDATEAAKTKGEPKLLVKERSRDDV